MSRWIPLEAISRVFPYYHKFNNSITNLVATFKLTVVIPENLTGNIGISKVQTYTIEESLAQTDAVDEPYNGCITSPNQINYIRSLKRYILLLTVSPIEGYSAGLEPPIARVHFKMMIYTGKFDILLFTFKRIENPSTEMPDSSR